MYEVEIGRTVAAKSDALKSPAAKRMYAVLAGEGTERLGRVHGVADFGTAGGMQRRRAGDDDEPGDDGGEQAADDHVPPRGPELPRGDPFFHD